MQTILCFRSSDLDKDVQVLKEKGVKIIQDIKEVSQGRFCVVTDPEDDYIEIIEN